MCQVCGLVFTYGFIHDGPVRYIAAQIFGAYIACLLVYVQWKDLIVVSIEKTRSLTLTHVYLKLAEEGLAARGLLDGLQFTPTGPGGIIALYTQPGANLGRVFLNEFVCVSPD